MNLWRYRAIDSRANGGAKTGELAGATAAEVRASLRRIGLQVIDVRPVRKGTAINRTSLLDPMIQLIQGHMRRRRCPRKAELFDSLATMLAAGLPLLQAFQTLIDSRGQSQRSRLHSMLIDVREQLRSGRSLGSALQDHPGWFDAMDVAIVQAGQHAGNLPEVLSSMAQRQARSNELGHKLIGALAYPFLVFIVGIGVAVFLSTKTLPELVKILEGAKIPPPELTLRVMWLGQLLAQHWMMIGIGVALATIGFAILPPLLQRCQITLPAFVPRFQPPKVLRTLSVGGLAMRLAELLRSGLPMVEALRVTAPTVSSIRLRRALEKAAEGIESGEELSAALRDECWFDAEFRRLLDIGQTSGELETMLQRIGERYQRQAQRLIDRLATLLEPLVILSLAVLVGIVVMAAILPLIRLQEILR